jgi:hypothetical protein
MPNSEKKPARSSDKDWQFIQDLAAAVEQSMLPEGAIVTCPDTQVWDHDTERYTEVDVSIRYKLGSVDILVVIECRDRTRTDDKTWIEQLVERKAAFHANVMIGVSASGFGKPAQLKAQKRGIELRHVKNIRELDTNQLLRVGTARYYTIHVMGIALAWPGGVHPKGVPERPSVELADAWRSPILVEGAGPERREVSLNDLVDSNRARDQLDNTEVPVGESVHGLLRFTPEPGKGLFFHHAGTDYPIAEAQFKLKISHIVETTTLDKLYQYARPGQQAIVHVGRGQLTACPEPVDFVVINEPHSGKITFKHLEKTPRLKRRKRRQQ